MAVTKVEANKAQQIVREALESAGYVIDRNFASYGPMLRLTLEMHKQDELSPAAVGLQCAGSSYGLPDDALGRTVTLGGKAFEITGLVPSRRKYPVDIVEVGTGRRMKSTISSITEALKEAK